MEYQTFFKTVSNIVYTSRKIDDIYINYCQNYLTLDKEKTFKIGLLTNHCQLKVKEIAFPIMISSISMLNAKALIKSDYIINYKEGLESVKNMNGVMKLTFQNIPGDNKSFLVFVKLSGLLISNDHQYYYLNLDFIRKPPDLLILLLGEYFMVSQSREKRKEQRIVMSPDVMKRLSIDNRIGIIGNGEIRRKFLIKDLSLTGLNIIIPGNGKEYLDKQVSLEICFSSNRIFRDIKARVVRYEQVNDSQYLSFLGIELEDRVIPIEYEKLIEVFFNLIDS